MTKPVFATALGMSDADKGVVNSLLEHLFPEIGPDEEEEGDFGLFGSGLRPPPVIKMHEHIHIENKLTCAQLFDYYAKSLAG